MAEAVAEGGGESTRLVKAGAVIPDDLLNAAGYMFCCPENLASMSGEMKEMFDRCYYPVLGQIEGRPYASIIAAGSDGEGAQRQLDRIATGWRLKRVTKPRIVCFDAQTPEAILAAKAVDPEVLEECRQIGVALVEGIRLGIF